MTSLPKDALKGVSSTKDVIDGVSDLVELTGAEKLSKPLSDIKTVVGNAEKVLNLSPYTLSKGSQLAVQLSSGNVLGAVSGLLGISSPTGLQFTLETVTLPPSTFSVISFELREGYSEPYCLTVHLSSSLDAIDASQVLDQKVKFTVWQSGKVERVI
ncbi:hypothetical protein, partial [Avibacterium volantium]|uniref:hypothetical protein n=1 Tax=Avibacterium TaxID=292486 RepID=UPI003BF92746